MAYYYNNARVQYIFGGIDFLEIDSWPADVTTVY